MAKSLRALAHSPSLSMAPAAASAGLASTSGRSNACIAPDLGALSLVLDASDEVNHLRDVHSAYSALEKLIAAHGVDESDEIHPSRGELSALLRVMNEGFQRRLESVETTVESIRSTLEEDGAH